MANGRNKGRSQTSSRDPGGFVALPWSVLDSPAYQSLGYPARALLMELCRQYVRDNNGRLLCSRAYLAKRGWNSADVIDRARRELLAAGFIHETVKGQRPNKASWYALTFYTLDRLPGFDAGAAETFERGAYRKNAPLCPSPGQGAASIGPSHGQRASQPCPPDGSISLNSGPSLCPSPGHLLDKPSAAAKGTSNAIH